MVSVLVLDSDNTRPSLNAPIFAGRGGGGDELDVNSVHTIERNYD